MSVYYNENDPKAAAWLRELIFEGQIAWGDVDERSIEDVKPSELVGYAQCHFFAGIGGWSYALRLAGWPDDKPVWTGSCPCQPFSAAGRQRGFEDPRHLWPVWYKLIRECAPSVIFGEQVASPAGLAWFDLVHADMEGSAYAVAAADLCAAGVGAPHGRQRLYWVAYADSAGRYRVSEQNEQTARAESAPRRSDADRCSRDAWAFAEPMEGADGTWRVRSPRIQLLADGLSEGMGLLRGYGNAIVPQVAAAFIEATGLA